MDVSHCRLEHCAVHLTGEYKLHGEFAVPHTAFTHHCELAGREDEGGEKDKGLVLAQGQVVPDRGLGVAQAQWQVVAL